jgi:hypothetical protein
MNTTIAALSSPSIKYAEFIRLTTSANAGSFLIGNSYTIQFVGTTNFVAIGASSNTVGVTFVATGVGAGTGIAGNVYTFCNAAAPITVSGMTFSNLGSFLSIGDIKRETKATSGDLTIALAGVDGANVGIVLAADIKGSLVEVWRGFLDSDNQIITTPTLQFFKRYQGYVSNYSVTEDWNEQARVRTATCSISCTSFRAILQNRISGLKTTPTVWQNFYPNDVSMNRVPVIASTFFDFGKAPIGGSQSATDAPSDNFGLNDSRP